MTVNILASGMVTPVGFSTPASCAAIRPGLSGARQTGFLFDGEWIEGARVSMPDESQGRQLLLRMATMATNECLALLPGGRVQDTLLLLCLPEEERLARFDHLDESFSRDLRAALTSAERFHPYTAHLSEGTMGGVRALELAARAFAQGTVDYCLIVGVDSYFEVETLTRLHAQRRLLTAKNADGFVPGEAAGALLLSRLRPVGGPLQCLSVGWGHEPSVPDSGAPLRADGLTAAYQSALALAGFGFEHLDYRISGEQNSFKEAAIALARTMRVRKEEFELWHPAESTGRLGAATVPIVLGVALRAAELGYAPGPGVLSHFSGDDGTRAAIVLREYAKPSRPALS